MKKLMPKPKGFTIIEVIIVLVIGAVIMLAVFVVVPQLQQSARNNQRRSDAKQVLVGLQSLQSKGVVMLPNGTNNIETLKNEISRPVFQDPSTNFYGTTSKDYRLSVRTGTYEGNGVAVAFEVKYNAKCTSSNTLGQDNSPGSIAVVVQLEPHRNQVFNSSTGATQTYGNPYCVDDSN